MSSRRLKSTILLAGVVANALILLAWTQTWVIVTLTADELGGAPVIVGGDIAAGGLSALALAGLALVGALSIAGPVFRVVLGALQSLIGATVALTSVVAIGDPAGAASRAITDSTGISGASSVQNLVESATLNAWPWFAAAVGVISVAIGVAIIATVRRWPAATRKYQAARLTGADGSTVDVDTLGAGTLDGAAGPDSVPGAAVREPDAIGDWDALSDGADPTSR
ncbi:Trp biosynthesis-associated membrane protein [Marisediminicola antarctica]|uniref:Peptidase n=1 Tax=Marisediminicola antarctica TaxID=674079 RepID=A0A7L5ALJ9_9MICO|nr:Trp biosynthesis-associated membrane protein [Marisediminicola antarctica]QHO70011.1 hypothetical protein BHD05_10520 [Marisediminicola antarctica]